ncbi:hypothetical protein ICI41_20910 [Pseudomonas aeruginosa]|uniref:hypothetical protein n=1 Tax=Pseudomonas aeruginosa TaxID=287 RepID=UPI001C5D5144|nr:hypothetical protein [Pseudomonas aeruginosa]QWY05830.1 hypothetical protein ICI41_20910 [Pseudomonas aeruginosa]
MSDDKVVPMKKREDRFEALIRDEAIFDELVLGAIKVRPGPRSARVDDEGHPHERDHRSRLQLHRV